MIKPVVIRRNNKPEPDNNTVVVNQKISQDTGVNYASANSSLQVVLIVFIVLLVLAVAILVNNARLVGGNTVHVNVKDTYDGNEGVKPRSFILNRVGFLFLRKQKNSVSSIGTDSTNSPSPTTPLRSQVSKSPKQSPSNKKSPSNKPPSNKSDKHYVVTMSETDGSLYKKDLIREMSLKIRDSPKRKCSDSPGFLRPSPRNSPMEIEDPKGEDQQSGDLLKSIQEEMKSPGRGKTAKIESADGKTPDLEDPKGNTSVA